MQLLLTRQPATDDAILGQLFVDSVFECFTLEGAAVAIPMGRYRVSITKSQRFGKMLPLVNDVPGRSGIRIHAGNTDADTEGCILVGLVAIEHDELLHSRAALADLQGKIAGALVRHEDVWITIQDHAEGTLSA